MITATMARVERERDKASIIPQELREIQQKIEKVSAQGATDQARADFIALARAMIDQERQRWQNQAVAQRHWGWRYARLNSALADILLRGAFQLASTQLAKTGQHLPLTVTALGGYGRGDLCPFSDLDILFLIERNKARDSNLLAVETLIENLLLILWDIGLQPGHSVRSIEECLSDGRKDWNLRTSFLDLRYLAGDWRGFTTLRYRIHTQLVAGFEQDITDEKWREMDQRHAAMGNSRYLLEPNVKEGKGGLRDIHTLWWIARAHRRILTPMELERHGILRLDETHALIHLMHFFLSVRCHLHLTCRHPEERLSFDSQEIIASKMGYTGKDRQSQFMREYFLTAREVGNIVHIFRDLFPARRSRLDSRTWTSRIGLPAHPLNRPRIIDGMHVADGQIELHEEAIAQQPWRMLQVFRIAQKEKLRLHHETLRALRRYRSHIQSSLRRDPKANRIFLAILTGDNAYAALSRMNDMDILGRFIPDFGRIVGSSQYDFYHAYTIDEHTLRVIRHVQQIEKGEWKNVHPLASVAISKIEDSRQALYVAAFIHDLGKRKNEDHSQVGARIAARLCPRIGLDAAQTDMAVWLVRHHLLMSHTAFRRDLDDPKTLDDFTTAVQSLERLRLLLVLTVADIQGVSPTTWTTWKKDLLTQLYAAAQDILTGRRDLRMPKNANHEREVFHNHMKDSLSVEEIKCFETLAPSRFWLAEPTRTQGQCARLILQAEKTASLQAEKTARLQAATTASLQAEKTTGPSKTFKRHFATSLLEGREKGNTACELAVYADSYPGVFSDIAGALTLAGGDIARAQVYRMHNGRTLAVFLVQSNIHWISDAHPVPFNESEKPARFRSFLEQIAEEKLDLDALLKERVSTLPRRARQWHVPPQVNIYNHLSRTWSVIEAVGSDRPGLLFALTRALADHDLRLASARIVSHGVRVVDVFYVRNTFGLKIESAEKIATLRNALIDVMKTDPPS